MKDKNVLHPSSVIVNIAKLTSDASKYASDKGTVYSRMLLQHGYYTNELSSTKKTFVSKASKHNPSMDNIYARSRDIKYGIMSKDKLAKLCGIFELEPEKYTISSIFSITDATVEIVETKPEVVETSTITPTSNDNKLIELCEQVAYLAESVRSQNAYSFKDIEEMFEKMFEVKMKDAIPVMISLKAMGYKPSNKDEYRFGHESAKGIIDTVITFKDGKVEVTQYDSVQDPGHSVKLCVKEIEAIYSHCKELGWKTL